ncbi:class I SAM-dependent methyltransferase, partial [Candidatus Woesearchaeota archaeon]|nr:class I SAM-dependent methyltransferase [Candidatus Woesearchaeota archaeon]
MINDKCEICGNLSWESVYNGDIRDGHYGLIRENSTVFQCIDCGVQRLLESDCIPPEYYDTGEYREKLNQSLSLDSEIEGHELLNRFTFESIWPLSVRNKHVLDVGCGSGHLLDALSGASKNQVGIEPCSPYLASIIEKGYEAYSSIQECSNKGREKYFDFGFSIQVIEHVLNPRLFLEDIRLLLKPGADLLISTPNRDDILMSLMPDDFPSFFYRTQHRWYFDANSLEFCAKSAGFEIVEMKYIHRYGMS